MRIFLGGTCNNSTWREEFIEMIKDVDGLSFFNPVVDDWTPEAQANEEREKKVCTIQLYVITKEMKGVFSIAEAVDSSNKQPDNTVFVVIPSTSVDESMSRSLFATYKMVRDNGAHCFSSLESCADYLIERTKSLKI